jgi:prepilin-type N-terminal cleavage/methylation domain-containing protein
MKKGFTLIELMIVIAIIAIIAAIAIPGLLAAQRASNERNASASLKTMSTAEADFRSNDRDGNLVNDFWTGDVFALYGLVPPTGGVTTLPADTTSATSIIKLIEPSVAGADGASQGSGTSYVNITYAASIVNGSPKAGYLYRMFTSQDDGGGATTLLVDTDGGGFYATMHDRNRFAVMAAPETLSAGKLLFIVNADNTIWKYNHPATYVCTFTAITGTTNSSSSITGTGQGTIDSAGTFPSSPGSLGFSKMD